MKVIVKVEFGHVINVRNYELVKAIGNKVREIILAKNLSQEELSYTSDLPVSQIGRIERGENNPTISSLYTIAEALDVELNSLVDVSFTAKKKKYFFFLRRYEGSFGCPIKPLDSAIEEVY